MQYDLFEQVLVDLNLNAPSVEAALLSSKDGIALAAHPVAFEQGGTGELSARVHALSHDTSLMLNRGELEHVLVQGEGGLYILVKAGNELVLTVMTGLNGEINEVWENIGVAVDKINQITL